MKYKFKRIFSLSEQGAVAAAAVVAMIQASRRLAPDVADPKPVPLEQLKELWERLCAEELGRLRRLAAAGDRGGGCGGGRGGGRHDVPGPLLDPVLMFADDSEPLVTEASLRGAESLRALAVLARVVSAARARRHNNTPWTRVLDAYQLTGRVSSRGVLRARWRQLAGLAARGVRGAKRLGAEHPLLLYVALVEPDVSQLEATEWRRGDRRRPRDDDDHDAPIVLDFTELEACKDVDAINEYIRKNFFDKEALSKFTHEEIKKYGLHDNSKSDFNDTIIALENLDPAKASISLLSVETCKIEDALGKIEDASGKIEDASGKIEDVSGKIEDASGKIEDVSGEIEDASGRTEDRVNSKINDMADVHRSDELSSVTGNCSSDEDEESVNEDLLEEMPQVDPKLLCLTKVQLSRIEDTTAWRKHARNGTVDVRRAGLLETCDKQVHQRNRTSKRIYMNNTILTDNCECGVSEKNQRMKKLRDDFLESIADKSNYSTQDCSSDTSDDSECEGNLIIDLESSYKAGAANPDLNPHLKNLSKTFLSNRNNQRLLKLCKPVVVRVKEMERPRKMKRVELADIDEVRRINRTILTAQVAPMQSQEKSKPENTNIGSAWQERELQKLKEDMCELFKKNLRSIRAMVESQTDLCFEDIKAIIDVMMNRPIKKKIYYKKRNLIFEEEPRGDPYEEWERQKRIVNRYFYFGTTDKRKRNRNEQNATNRQQSIVTTKGRKVIDSQRNASNVGTQNLNPSATTGNPMCNALKVGTQNLNRSATTGNPMCNALNVGTQYLNPPATTGNPMCNALNVGTQNLNPSATTGNPMCNTLNIGTQNLNLSATTGNLMCNTLDIGTQNLNPSATTGNSMCNTLNIGSQNLNPSATTGNLMYNTLNIGTQNLNPPAITGNPMCNTLNVGTQNLNPPAITGNPMCNTMNIGTQNLNPSAITGNLMCNTLNIGTQNLNSSLITSDQIRNISNTLGTQNLNPSAIKTYPVYIAMDTVGTQNPRPSVITSNPIYIAVDTLGTQNLNPSAITGTSICNALNNGTQNLNPSAITGNSICNELITLTSQNLNSSVIAGNSLCNTVNGTQNLNPSTVNASTRQDILFGILNTGNEKGPDTNNMPHLTEEIIIKEEVTPVISSVCSLAQTETIEDDNESHNPMNIETVQEEATNIMDAIIKEELATIKPLFEPGTNLQIPVVQTPSAPPNSIEPSEPRFEEMSLKQLLLKPRSHKITSTTTSSITPKPNSLPTHEFSSNSQTETQSNELQPTSAFNRSKLDILTLSQMLSQPPLPMTKRLLITPLKTSQPVPAPPESKLKSLLQKPLKYTLSKVRYIERPKPKVTKRTPAKRRKKTVINLDSESSSDETMDRIFYNSEDEE